MNTIIKILISIILLFVAIYLATLLYVLFFHTPLIEELTK